MALELPMLYARGKGDRILQWRVSTDNDLVIMENGILGGKMNVNTTRSKPTNVGRANQRLGPDQARFEAQSAWQKKRDEGYFETIESAKTEFVLLPMKAYPLIKKLKRKGETVEVRRDIFYPCHAQRKYNGLRCLGTHDKLLSAEGVSWNLKHIRQHVNILMQGDKDVIIDGEIYIHGVPLQTLNSLIKDYREPESLALEYHLYDLPMISGDKSLPWEERWKILHALYSDYLHACHEQGLVPCIKLAETIWIENEAQIVAFEKIVIAEGYEGLIIRMLQGVYAFNDRVEWIIKWKRFTDAEFLVIDAKSRELIKDGKSIIICDKFVCQNNMNEKTFECVPMGDETQKVKFWTDRAYYIGKRMTVRFLERSVDGIPQGNPVGRAFRLDEDLPPAEPDMWKE